MAIRPLFIPCLGGDEYVKTVQIDFSWHPGFSISQKRKSIEELHNSAVKSVGDLKILEISTASKCELGKSLSAFNLTIKTKKYNKMFSVESAFQASKVFEKGGPYVDLLLKTSKEAKTDPRLRESGGLVKFKFYDTEWPLEPKTLFYDWLYMKSLMEERVLTTQILEYDAFTDIAFNPKRSINCQAHSAALFVSLFKRGLVPSALNSIEEYISLFHTDNTSADLIQRNLL